MICLVVSLNLESLLLRLLVPNAMPILSIRITKSDDILNVEQYIFRNHYISVRLVFLTSLRVLSWSLF
jgi:hypothetical protein